LAPGWRATVRLLSSQRFADPFGVAVSRSGTVYVADGANGNRIYSITPAREWTIVAGGEEGFVDGVGVAARFSTPSGLAAAADGTIYVADTGNNAVRRITPNGHVSTLATGLNGPTGIVVDPGGRVLVSDTYSDRIAFIERNGQMSTLAINVAVDTPTGLALAESGTLFIADTGHDLVHAVGRDGSVTTIDAAGIGGFLRPHGVAVDSAGTLYVTDESRVIEVTATGHTRVLAGSSPGFRDGLGDDAEFRRPAGIAAQEPGRLVVADSGNGFVRTVTATTLAEATPPSAPVTVPAFDTSAFRSKPLLWPLEPLYGPFEIAGTLGEARGPDAGRFHAGIDVRAEQGTMVLAVRDGVVSSALSTGDFGTVNEWLRVGELTYVHIRVGRTHRDELLDTLRFVATRDERGRIARVRVKRGAQFRTGDVLGTVNAFNHVHLNVGWGGEEHNPLLFRLVQFEDTIAPTIARNGVRLFDQHGTPLTQRVRNRILVSGPVQVVVDAWDQANGNVANRRLGVYSLGYEVLRADGSLVPGFEAMRETIRFDRLIAQPEATRYVFAPGSGIPFYGQRRTRFLYIVTNTFRDGVAAAGAWDTTQLAPGDYTLRVRVADINGNEAIAHRDLPVTVTGSGWLTGG
jgi:sugar lactone lactonase YvrE